MEGFQTVPYPLPSVTFAAGGRASVPLRTLPPEIMGRVAHVIGYSFECILAPAFTTAPTVIGQNAMVARLELFDGQQVRFSGGFNDLRMFERLECGGELTPESPTTGTTGQTRCWERTLFNGPPLLLGSPTDHAYPCASLENGELRFTFGALTDISADTTAATGTINVTAHLVLLDKIRVPPYYERQVYTLSGSDQQFPSKALYAFVGLCNSSSYDAFTVGDLANITVDTGKGQVVPAVHAAVLWRKYNKDFGRGRVGGLVGDPRATTDVAPRDINYGTPTALQAAVADQQPVIWMPPDGRITKIVADVETNLRVRWSGANGSGTIMHVGRFLEQPSSVRATIALKTLQKFGKGGDVPTTATLTGGNPGPKEQYLPADVKFTS
jgi:hypothetical protein